MLTLLRDMQDRRLWCPAAILLFRAPF